MLRTGARRWAACCRPLTVTVPASSSPVLTTRRLATTSSAPGPGSTGGGGGRGLRSALLSTALLVGAGVFLVYAHDSSAGIYRWILTPSLLWLTQDDPEKAHELAISVIQSGFAPVDRGVDDERLSVEVWGKKLASPIGIAAGFDKHAQAIDGLFKLGFSYVEVGSVTPEPQSGNPRPRVFRVPESFSVVNRYGFNSDGHQAVLSRLRNRIHAYVSTYAPLLPPDIFPPPPSHALPSSYDVVKALLESPAGRDASIIDALGFPRSLHEARLLGVNLGKNKSSDPDSIDDFVNGVATLGPLADVLVINVSSPNTPGLRTLQRKGMVNELLESVVEARNALPQKVKPPVLVKIAPDLTSEQIADIGKAVLAAGIDGVIVSNTTVSRPPSAGNSPVLSETGGLSGPPVKPLALKALSAMRDATDGKVTLVGCGGISSGQDAVDYAKAGATLVQAYTALVYEGFGLPRKLKDEVGEILEREGKTWMEIVGSGVAPKIQQQQQEPIVLEEVVTPPQPPPLTEDDFQNSLESARKELEDLLTQLAQIEAAPTDSSSPAPHPTFSSPSLPSSIESESPSQSTSFPAVSETVREEEHPVAPEPSPITTLRVETLLDHQQIMSLLEPVAAATTTTTTAAAAATQAHEVQDQTTDKVSKDTDGGKFEFLEQTSTTPAPGWGDPSKKWV